MNEKHFPVCTDVMLMRERQCVQPEVAATYDPWLVCSLTLTTKQQKHPQTSFFASLTLHFCLPLIIILHCVSFLLHLCTVCTILYDDTVLKS